MKLVLFKGLDKDAKDMVEDEYNSSIRFREQVVKVLNEYKEAEFDSMAAKKVFDTPSWSHKQASSIGYVRAINDFLSLIE